MDAGSSFDTDTVLREFPTVLTGAIALIFIKASTIFLATRVPKWIEPNRLPVAEGIRLALLLAGGGEFAFVVLALAEKLGVLPNDLGSLLTAIVLITMAVTPFLGQLAETASQPFLEDQEGSIVSAIEGSVEGTEVAENAIVVCGYGEIGQACLRVLYEEYRLVKDLLERESETRNLPYLVAFGTDASLTGNILMPSEDAAVLFGDASNPVVLQSAGITEPSALFVSYEDAGRISSATARLRSSFPETPIYTRAQTRREAQSLKDVGATEVIIESDELPRSATAFLWTNKLWSSTESMENKSSMEKKLLQKAASTASGLPMDITDALFELYQCMDQDLSGEVTADEIANLITKSNAGIHSDDEVEEMIALVRDTVVEPLDIVGFCRFYSKSSPLVKQAMSDACMF